MIKYMPHQRNRDKKSRHTELNTAGLSHTLFFKPKNPSPSNDISFFKKMLENLTSSLIFLLPFSQGADAKPIEKMSTSTIPDSNSMDTFYGSYAVNGSTYLYLYEYNATEYPALPDKMVEYCGLTLESPTLHLYEPYGFMEPCYEMSKIYLDFSRKNPWNTVVNEFNYDCTFDVASKLCINEPPTSTSSSNLPKGMILAGEILGIVFGLGILACIWYCKCKSRPSLDHTQTSAYTSLADVAKSEARSLR